MDPLDVAIVGGGPAGAWAGYVLACGGARVSIFDPSHPREKPCGGGVTRRAMALIAGATIADALPTTRIRTARFSDSASGTSTVVALDDGSTDAALIVSSRAAFDGELLAAARRAGATIVSSRVIAVRASGKGVQLDTTAGSCFANFVIGADGANSLVRRRVLRPFRRDQLSIATGYFAHGVTSDEIVIELLSDPPGYFWSFPRPDHLAIGGCANADAGLTAGVLRQAAASWIARAGIARGARLQEYAWPIPSLSARDFDNLEVAGPRWSLVGDAAGLVDPITREGIYFALASGQWAAEAILSGRSSGYTARVRQEAAPELASAARFKVGFFRPAFIGLLTRALAERASIRGVMADLVAGRQSYSGLRSRLLRTFEWRLAALALLGM